jgi:hypothetical protein
MSLTEGTPHMLKMTPEVAKYLRDVLAQMSTHELVAIRQTIPETSTRVAPEILNFIRNNTNVLLKSRADVSKIEAEVKQEIAIAKRQRAVAKRQQTLRSAVKNLQRAIQPATAQDDAFFASFYAMIENDFTK